MNSISTLTVADLTTAYNIEQASHVFPWTEATLASNQGERYLNLKLSSDGLMVGFAITQIVLDNATLFHIAIHLQWQRCGFGRRLLHALIEQLNAVAGSTCLQRGGDRVVRRSRFQPSDFAPQLLLHRQRLRGRDCHGAAAN